MVRAIGAVVTAKGFAIDTTELSSHPISLVDAMVLASSGSLLLLDIDLVVIAASNEFKSAFSLPVNDFVGKSVFNLGHGEWNLPRFHSLFEAVAAGSKLQPYEIIFMPPGEAEAKCLEVNAKKIEYDVPGVVRLLVAITDLTDARAAKVQTDKLIADKVLLNRELQHRVANSLQIIASVLMQSAGRVTSDEARGHLHQAHNRVISIAEVQRQLASTGAEKICLRAYFTQLCASIAASMIEDPERLTIRVEVDDSEVTSDTSISLGLIVTEFVINALKHGFPNGRSGKILVDFAGNGHDKGWMLEVADDGVGMPLAGATPAIPGLGTSIVEALIRQQGARLTIAAGHPGTIVSIRHESPGNLSANVLPLGRAI